MEAITQGKPTDRRILLVNTGRAFKVSARDLTRQPTKVPTDSPQAPGTPQPQGIFQQVLRVSQASPQNQHSLKQHDMAPASRLADEPGKYAYDGQEGEHPRRDHKPRRKPRKRQKSLSK